MYASDVHEIGRLRLGQVDGVMPVDEHQRRVAHQPAGVRRVGPEVLPAEGRRPPVRPLEDQVREHVVVSVRHPLHQVRGHGERRVKRGHVRGVRVTAQRVVVPRVHVARHDHGAWHVQVVRHVRVARRGQQLGDEQVESINSRKKFKIKHCPGATFALTPPVEVFAIFFFAQAFIIRTTAKEITV